MTLKEKRTKMSQVTAALKQLYPDAQCALNWQGDPWRLLVMGRLSAQCTDARVNIVCEELFRVFPDARAMAEGELSLIEEIVKPCGLYKMKAKSIKEASAMLVERYGGTLPDDMDSLLEFPGVGRKIANLLLGDVYGKPAVVCDTHCIRICGRLGFYPESLKDPAKIEQLLRGIIEPAEGSDFCHRIVIFGREVCTARSPACEGCPLAEYCSSKIRRARREGKA